MAMSVGGGAGEYKSDINITPLVDVVLVLLIIFMVITPLLQMGYDVKIPPKVDVPAGTPPPTDLIVVSLTAQNKIFLNKEEVTPQVLSLRLTEILKNRANKTIFFSGDDNANYGDVVTVMDRCRNAGAKNIGIVMEAVPVGQ
ncbi:MAG TPA: biopolymer transporter ExbD [Thermoanaerobaculia bacterium]|nr:biopolymer transporter ExbD [Thermoanaerobaculia bacterium]